MVNSFSFEAAFGGGSCCLLGTLRTQIWERRRLYAKETTLTWPQQLDRSHHDSVTEGIHDVRSKFVSPGDSLLPGCKLQEGRLCPP